MSIKHKSQLLNQEINFMIMIYKMTHVSINLCQLFTFGLQDVIFIFIDLMFMIIKLNIVIIKMDL